MLLGMVKKTYKVFLECGHLLSHLTKDQSSLEWLHAFYEIMTLCILPLCILTTTWFTQPPTVLSGVNERLLILLKEQHEAVSAPLNKDIIVFV